MNSINKYTETVKEFTNALIMNNGLIKKRPTNYSNKSVLMNISEKEEQSTLNSSNSSLKRVTGQIITEEEIEAELNGEDWVSGMEFCDSNELEIENSYSALVDQSNLTGVNLNDFDLQSDVAVLNFDDKKSIMLQQKIKHIGSKYHLGYQLGEGSVGVVRYGYQKGAGLIQYCAIKIIQKDHVYEDNYEIELKVLQMIQHPNILQINDLLYDKKCYYQVWEFAQHGDLFDFQSQYKNRQVPEFLVKQIASQMLLALCHLDSQDIIHRDIKPENILITNIDPENKKITVKLADFDAAKFCAKNSVLIGKAGTYEYMAPEMFLNSSYSSNLDVWSFCVVIYTQLFGNFPFPGQVPGLIKYNVLRTEPSYKQQGKLEINQEAVDFLKFGLIKDKRMRPSCHQMLQHPWLKSQI